MYTPKCENNLNNLGSTAPLMEENINLIFVGWVERSETQH